MAKFFESITPELKQFLESSPLFFVATAPLNADGRVNLSPKGHDTFRVLDPNTVAYLDMTGSGNETAAHIMENARLTIMACAFSGRPEIVRLYCNGRVVSRGSSEWKDMLPLFPAHAGTRQIIIGEVESLQTSCGYAVPEMTRTSDRDTLHRWAESKGEEGLVEYRQSRNSRSIDGIPTPPTDPKEVQAGE
jgi:hypothetical protein